MNLLRKIETYSVDKTGRMHNIRIKGENRVEPIYKVKIDDLFFNDQNDRIATYIEKYKKDNDLSSIDRNDLVSYNDIIHQFIFESNPESIKKTKANISLMGQRQPAIILSDGRVIDGNRRFACLRELYKETGDEKFNYLDAVIIKEEFEHNKREIKILELEIQHGEESKVDYDPIEKLVGIYNDIHKNKLLDIKIYAKSVNKKDSEIKKELEIAILISEFLALFGFEEQFYLAKELKLDGPIREIYNTLKSISDDDERERLKKTAFALLISKKDGDKSRYFRELKKITDNLNLFLSETENDVIDIIDYFDKFRTTNTVDLLSNLYEKDFSNSIHNHFEKNVNLQNSKETKDKPKTLVEKSIDNLKMIDTNIVKKLDKNKKTDLDLLLDSLFQEIIKIKKYLNE